MWIAGINFQSEGDDPTYREFLIKWLQKGGGQNLERPNVEQPIFRKFETSNIEIIKVELFDFFQNLFLIFTSVFIVRTLKIYDILPNWKFLEF